MTTPKNTNVPQSRTKSYLAGIFAFVIWLVGGFSFAIAQDKHSQQNLHTGIPYSISDIENINLTNGNLMFNFDFGTVQGRGSAASSFGLKYNSKLYETHVMTTLDMQGDMSPQKFLRGSYESGWQYDGSYDLRVINRNDDLDEPIQISDSCGKPNYKAVYVWKLIMYFPDGSQHEFRPTGYSDTSQDLFGQLQTGDGFFNVDPAGHINDLAWGSNTNSTGVVTTDIDANTTIVTDQAGNKRRTVNNALGHLIRVDEPNDAGQLDVGGSPFQSTNYTYDVLNNLLTVVQGNQTRTFAYSSLSRMTAETNPEAGTTSYEFDNNGNPTKTTDSRGVSIHFVYDALNRVTQKSYSGESGYTTPTITYTHDGVANAKGRLTKVSSSISENRYLSFDKMGRVTQSEQFTDGQTYGFEYAYNLAGMLIEQTYPSGRKVKNVFENAGELSMVQSKESTNHGYYNYAKNFTYTASGAVTSMQLGNGQWQSNQFNSRLQMTRAALGTTPQATKLLNLDFDYGSNQNNGNLISQTITVPTVGVENGFTAIQNYAYDSLNRLKSATENISSNETWKQTFIFDRYGNRNFDEALTTTLPKNCGEAMCAADRKVFNPSVNTSNNRLNASEYDSTGNTTDDPHGRVFKYDGENKQYEVRNSQNEIIGQYFFDGGGKRVKKIVPATGEVTIFVYDATGRLSAEYSTQLSQAPKVSYMTSDHLGSPRIKTDQNGVVISRNDYHPYGEDVLTPQRTQGLGYKPDDVRQKFTGYQKDNETDLDFAQARMYANRLGRFSTTDPSRKSIQPKNPQTWNRYSYCYNNPVVLIDDNGKWPTRTRNKIIQAAFGKLTPTQVKHIQAGSLLVDTVAGGKIGSTLWPSEAHKHAMTADGLTANEARGLAQAYLNKKLADARAYQRGYEALGNKGLSPTALIVLGEATHTYEDMTSPANGFDKIYKIPTRTRIITNPDGSETTITAYDGDAWAKDIAVHKKQESGEITDEQLQASVDRSRAFFLLAFGRKKFESTVESKDDRERVYSIVKELK